MKFLPLLLALMIGCSSTPKPEYPGITYRYMFTNLTNKTVIMHIGVVGQERTVTVKSGDSVGLDCVSPWAFTFTPEPVE